MNGIVKNTMFYAIGEILPKLLSFLLLPIFTRFLTPDDYGILSYTGSVTMLLTVLGMLCLNSYVLRFYFDKETVQERKGVIGTAFMAIALFNIFLFVIGYIFFPIIINKCNIQIPWDPYFKLAFISNFFSSFCTIPFVIYRVRKESVKFVALNFCSTLIHYLSNIIFIVVLDMGLLGYFYSTIICNVLFFFVYLFIIHKYACFKINITYLKEGLKFSLPLLPASLAYFALMLSDRIILERYVSLADIGLYNIAITLAGALGIVVQSGYRAIEPEIFDHYGKENYYSFVRKLQSVYYVAIFSMAFCLSLFSQELFFLMTDLKFYGGYIYVPILVAGAVMSGQNVIFSGLLSAEKRTKILGAISIIGAIFSLSFNILLIPLFGVIAAALSRMASYTLMNHLQYLKITFPNKTKYRETIAVILGLIVPYTAFFLFPNITFLSIAIKIIVSLMYFILLLKLFQIKIVDINLIIPNNIKIFAHEKR